MTHNRQSPRRLRRRGFTLLEVVLAIALSSVLLGLLTLAVNQYLLNVQSSRDAVEHAQVARGVLRMIADDLRNTATVYQQDTSSIAALAQAAADANFDPDSVDDTVDPAQETSGTEVIVPPIGVAGDLATLQVDVLRTRRAPVEQPEEFAVVAAEGLTFDGPPTGSGISTVRYSLAPTGGLVRQEVARDVALWEEGRGTTGSWDAVYRVVAEEVVGLEFRYSDGLGTLEAWDLEDRDGENPLAVEVRVTLREPSTRATATQDQQAATRSYRMTVALPAVDVDAGDDPTAASGGEASSTF